MFFFDEAHLLFADASRAFREAIAQTVRLIRSKGVGVFFVTQSPTDVPDEVLAQLGSRVQHQLRAHTPKDAKALKQTVNTYPSSAYDDLGQVITTVDRESAREKLAARLEAGAAAAKAEAQAKVEKAPRRTEPKPRPRKAEDGMVETVVKSTAFKQLMRTAAREIVRGVFNTGRRR